jgi:hypothetical protein
MRVLPSRRPDMPKEPPKRQRTSKKSITIQARKLVRLELIARGASRVDEEKHGRSTRLRAWNSVGDRQFLVRVRARKSGDWHASLTERDPGPTVQALAAFWVFVDLSVARSPVFFIVPEWWMRRDIHHHHEGYLLRHGGVRPKVPESDHHAIERYRVKKWKAQWQLLSLTN